MKRLLSLTLAFALLAALCGCGSKFFIRGAINTGTVRGTVSAVELSIVSDNGASVTVTYPASPEPEPTATKRRVEFPLVRSDQPGSLDLTNEQIEEILIEQDAASVAGLLITTEAMVAEVPRKQAPAMPPGAGGMGGGMDF